MLTDRIPGLRVLTRRARQSRFERTVRDLPDHLLKDMGLERHRWTGQPHEPYSGLLIVR